MLVACSLWAQTGRWVLLFCLDDCFCSKHMYTCFEMPTQIDRTPILELVVSCQGSLNLTVQLIKALCGAAILDLHSPADNVCKCGLQFVQHYIISVYFGCSWQTKGRLEQQCANCVLNLHLFCLFTPHFLQSKRGSKDDKINLEVASFTLWTLLPPEAFSPAAELSGVLSPWLTPLCSGSIVLPALGMLTSTVLKNTQTHMQTHIYVCTYLWAHSHSFVNLADG